MYKGPIAWNFCIWGGLLLAPALMMARLVTSVLFPCTMTMIMTMSAMESVATRTPMAPKRCPGNQSTKALGHRHRVSRQTWQMSTTYCGGVAHP